MLMKLSDSDREIEPRVMTLSKWIEFSQYSVECLGLFQPRFNTRERFANQLLEGQRFLLTDSESLIERLA